MWHSLDVEAKLKGDTGVWPLASRQQRAARAQ
jgi:hypothetical protein